jgi:glutamate-ammonia-ligase adenylyltransferase
MFDVKHSVGGMVDIEFAVQHLVLSQARHHPSLRPNLGNTALLLNAEAVGLLPQGMGLAASQAYRALRHLQHHARLDETHPEVDPATMAVHIAAVQALWQHVLGADAPPAP